MEVKRGHLIKDPEKFIIDAQKQVSNPAKYRW